MDSNLNPVHFLMFPLNICLHHLKYTSHAFNPLENIFEMKWSVALMDAMGGKEQGKRLETIHLFSLRFSTV